MEQGQEERKPIQVKRIDMTKPSFMANGKEYFITTVLSISRFCEYQLLENEMGFSVSFSSLFKEVNDACELFDNSMNFGDMAKARIKLDNLRRGIANLELKEPAVLKMCTLFINTEKEDPAIWNNDLMTVKIEDWKAEGFAIDDFFSFALSTQNGFTDIFLQMSERLEGIK